MKARDCKPGDIVFVSDEPCLESNICRDNREYFAKYNVSTDGGLIVVESPTDTSLDCVEVRDHHGNATPCFASRLYRDKFRETAARAIYESKPVL